MTTIYLELLDEGTPCWREVQVKALPDGSYLILGICPDDEGWAFQTGDIVHCKQHQFQNGTGLLAFEKARKEQ